MLILALDTSLDACAVAVMADGRLVAERCEVIGRGHAERLMGLMTQTLAAAGAGLGDIDRLGVSIGPGSFTGIRVGLAAARGLRLALGVPLVGVSTLDALAEAHAAAADGLPLVAAWDARRDEVYARFYDAAGQPLGAPFAASAATVAARFGGRAHAAAGSGAPLVAAHAGALARVVATPTHPPVAAVARLAARSAVPDAAPAPLYLRAPDAQPPARAGVARQVPTEAEGG